MRRQTGICVRLRAHVTGLKGVDGRGGNSYVMEVDGGEGTADEEFIEATEAR